MTGCTVRDEVFELIQTARHYSETLLGEKQLAAHVGNFVCTTGFFGYEEVVLLKKSDEHFLTHVSWSDSNLFIRIKKAEQAQEVFLTGDVIYDQPCFLRHNIRFPVFHHRFRRNSDGSGRHIFFRVDLSLETFAYYEDKNDFNCIKQGNSGGQTVFPDSIAGLNSFLGESIHWRIDFDAHARAIVNTSRLRQFFAECKKRSH